jgi:Zn-dependent metalloprotease
MPCHDPLRCILPPKLLEQLAKSETDPDARAAILDTLTNDRHFRLARAESASRSSAILAPTVTFARVGGNPNRTIYNQQNNDQQTFGAVARTEGQAPVADNAVNQAYDGFGATYSFYWDEFQRDSLDGQGLPLIGAIHYGSRYNNAFWDGDRAMWFGDGDGRILTETTAGIDVIGHEMTHGVTQHEANFPYSGQSGALNESVSDVFGIMVKQRALGQDVAASDWLIGAEIVGPLLKPALRSMKDPGHANPHDTQVADMDHYLPNGDVHENSGIPNRAFYLVATQLGGNAWDKAGPIWYETLCDPSLRATRRPQTFALFARTTLKHAQRTYGSGSNEVHAVRNAWQTVKVIK